jgi:hypothetical protein
MRVRFEKEKQEMDQTKKEIFNGYQAIVRLMKGTLIDARLIGCQIPFCRSMEVFKSGDFMSATGTPQNHALAWRLD